ncbi:ABC transporter permease [Brevibacillus borstelensis AK1]|uniref:ABC transporter permease n=1 Tax=Brevibacillus borstelensis AK1 TaxID=1300222 RepID=M8E8E8_9BACL|nr:ABC transporter permease [Brevibacillus borstelensis]EMT51755.1 ABC transporter permease [Brevibacillus borstelensis AK1]MED2008983.1 ABC transporter permease [Brevibacillus borstelensis]
MLLKLSLSSMRKMMKDYLVLLIGLVISITIFYMFQTLALNGDFTKQNSVISSIQLVFNVGSVLLAFITFFYIFYANSFLLSLRRKELGMYMILGAKKRKISQILFLETLVLGIISLVIGTIAGAGLASGVGSLLMKQLDISLEGYQPFYLPSIMMTCGFFLVLFLLTSSVNAIKLARTTELDLIRAEQQNDRVQRKGFATVLLALIGLAGLAAGYYALVHMEELREIGLFIAASATTIGTYLIFITLLPVFVNALKKNRVWNERKLNAFTFAQLRFRVNNLTKVLGTVAMLIALGVGAMAGGMAFQKNVSLMAEMGKVYDVIIHKPVPADYEALKAMTVEEQNTYRYKVDDAGIYYLKDDLLADPPLINTIGLEDYDPDNRVKRVSTSLPSKVYSVYDHPEENLGPDIESMPPDWQEAVTGEFINSYEMINGKAVRIVDQTTYSGIQGEERSVVLAKVDDFLKYKQELKEIDERQTRLYADETGAEGPQLYSKYTTYASLYAFTSGTMFMGFFLGIAFLAMMASCLMFKILSGATRDKDRYSMLRKIGVRQEWLVGSIYKELFVVFVFPALIGLVHVLVGMNMFSFILEEPYVGIWVPISIFLVIYTFYYWITVQLYKGIVLPKEA